ncbi:transferase, partial [Streptomyces sp. NPDC057052]
MTAESTVPPPGTQPGFAHVSVMPRRESATGFRFPARRPATRRLSPLPLLLADGLAAPAGALALAGAQH